MSKLRKIATLAKRKTAEARNEAENARRVRADRMIEILNDESQCAAHVCNPRATKPANATDVRQWIVGAVREIYPNAILPAWGGKENALAKRLLDTYGSELVHAAVVLMVDGWEHLRSTRGVKGLPSVAFLWAAKDIYFGEVQLPKARVAKNSDEWEGEGAIEEDVLS